jgi:phospholipase C
MATTKARKHKSPSGDLQFSNVVVLMLENCSFDHVFGFLGLGEGLNNHTYTNYLRPGDSSSQAFQTKSGGDYAAVGEGPSHSLKQVNEQLFGKTKVDGNADAGTATLSGFVSSFEASLRYDLKRAPTKSELQQAMNCFDPVQLPVLSTLATSFVLCDHWFADVPGPTMPDRAFVHAATSQGYTYNADWKPKFTCDTIYDRINGTPGTSWRVYYHDQNDVLEL